MQIFDSEEGERVAQMLGLSERAALGTCILSGACATPIYLSSQGFNELTPVALAIQAFLLPMIAGLALVASGDGGFRRWYESARENPLVLAIVAVPAFATALMANFA
jgi:hypothetical protein